VTLEVIALLLVIACLCGIVLFLLRWNRRERHQFEDVHENVDKVIQMVKTLCDESDGIKIDRTHYPTEGGVLQTHEPLAISEKDSTMESDAISEKNGNVLIALGKLSTGL